MGLVEKRKFSVREIRQDFPALRQQIYGKNLIYFDNGATSQKPQLVLDAINQYYSKNNANIHRGVHFMSQQATSEYEMSREYIKSFINAEKQEEIIFTKGTTDGINLVAYSYGSLLSAGDEILISAMEHHSNIVPWQLLCERKGLILKVIPINSRGELKLDVYEELLSDKTKLVAVTHISNTLGTINPLKIIIDKAHATGAKVLVDGAQSIQHTKVDVQDLDCDFFVFSGHKVFGPTGIGVLYGKEDLLDKMPPYQGGGDMIAKVTFERSTYNELPFKFEAGTPHIAGGICLGTALQYLNQFNIEDVEQYERSLADYAQDLISTFEGVKIIGTAKDKTSVVSFHVDGLHPFDIGTLLDKQGIAVRTGHHCTQPLMDIFKIPGTIRASFAFYNTREEIDTFIAAVEKSISMLR
ncbi:MAG: cysteine sulfinate desulfinase [Candidatus Fluviicola riflensis]|nr:MAG: cysteine desulfurase CsdA [Candidatus Fluviicola riflensis]OGS76614.1 MAG: cysteine sulfinate desulfinase [Candidatus Fluviicola riflensis]OGS83031.1 MAG: cysteine sulfinate desulfinase [Fluviicola sp. RIFCSPHIGHO2_01_FULL_43_53]OGS88345.1 MAG: cysteine sulfinate desulfinase [Fluviicola sp. RIFCSPHIGHO2_12_FULL_43_24]